MTPDVILALLLPAAFAVITFVLYLKRERITEKTLIFAIRCHVSENACYPKTYELLDRLKISYAQFNKVATVCLARHLIEYDYHAGVWRITHVSVQKKGK